MSPPEPDPVRVRAAARGWVTRCSKKLQELCATEEVDLVQLNDAIEEFDARLNVLDNAQSIVELELPDEKLEADIKAAAEFREKSRVPHIAATKIIANEQNESLGTAARADSASVGSQDARLPKLQLPTFSGDIKLWAGFGEQFEVAVDKSDMPDISKLSYLLSLLKGEAKLAVNGLSLTATNYKTACEILRKRYGRPERLIFCHIQDLLNLSVPKQPKTSVLWEMYDTLQSHVRSLEVLGISGSQYGVVLTPLILSRLPPDMRLEWAREGEQHEGDLDFLLKFLLGEIGRRERSQTFVKETVGSVAQETRTTRVATAAALHITSGDKNCVLCGRSSHPVHKCYNLTKVPVGDRKSVLSEAHLCFKCLSPKSSGHDFRKCAVKCARCSGSHHMILCHNTKPQTHSKHTAQQSQDTDSSGPHAPTTSAATNTSVATQADSMSSTGVIMLHKGMTCNPKGKSHVLLQTAKVKVRGSKGTADAVVLFDTGSDRTYMSERLVNAIGPEWIHTQHVSYASFGSSEPSAPVLRNVYSVSLCGCQGSVTITATEVPTICAAMYRPPLPPSVVEMLGDDVQLVDLDEGEITVDIVVGLDVYWRLMSTEVITLPLGLVAQRSVFGWIVSGSLADSQSASHCHVQVSHQLLCLNDVSESTIRQFWELESVGICESAESDPVMENFKMTVQHCEGRYSVALPWKSKSFKLLANEAGARRRLDKLSKKLAEDPALECRYNEALREMESTGVIHEVPQDEVVSPHLTYYLPHRPVVKEASVSTKIRPVFDASAKGPSGVSLNDCLEIGPCLLPSLVEILIRFRRWKIALTSDIQKAFLQIRVRREDQDVHRFFWMDQDKVRIMRLDRVPFGNKSSPFLLNATIQWHLSQYPHFFCGLWVKRKHVCGRLAIRGRWWKGCLPYVCWGKHHHGGCRHDPDKMGLKQWNRFRDAPRAFWGEAFGFRVSQSSGFEVVSRNRLFLIWWHCHSQLSGDYQTRHIEYHVKALWPSWPSHPLLDGGEVSVPGFVEGRYWLESTGSRNTLLCLSWVAQRLGSGEGLGDSTQICWCSMEGRRTVRVACVLWCLRERLWLLHLSQGAVVEWSLVNFTGDIEGQTGAPQKNHHSPSWVDGCPAWGQVVGVC